MKLISLVVGLCAVLVADCSSDASSGYFLQLQEASGVTAVGDTLFFVGDDNDGRYFKLPLTDTTAHVLAPDPNRLIEVMLPGAELASDLESIDILQDGRVAVLSEDLVALVGQTSLDSPACSLIATYPPAFNEFGNRGLEGLAVRPGPDGGSQVALLWEGGYPVLESLPYELQHNNGNKPLHPMIFVHTIPYGQSPEWTESADMLITLYPPKPAGIVPDAMRYRGCDLVWHTWHEGDSLVDGFIVEISASNSPSDAPPEYQSTEALRFRMDGTPVGQPMDLRAEAVRLLKDLGEPELARYPDSLREHIVDMRNLLSDPDGPSVNFEGMGWYRKGERLVIVYDAYPKEPTLVFFIDIPDDWK